MSTWLRQGYQRLKSNNDPEQSSGGDVNNESDEVVPENSGITIQDSASQAEAMLYRYEPSKLMPALKLYSARSETENLRCIIRKSTLLIVEHQDSSDWWYILAFGFEGWVLVPENVASSSLTRKYEYTRYEEWKGNNMFCCGGSLMFGSDGRFFIFTNVLMAVPSILMVIFVTPDAYYPTFTTSLVGILYTLSALTLWQTALTEPGIVPRVPR